MSRYIKIGSLGNGFSRGVRTDVEGLRMSFRPLRLNGVHRKRGTAIQAVQAKAQQSMVAATIRFVRTCHGRAWAGTPYRSPQKSQGTLLRSHQLQRAQAGGPKALPQGSLCRPCALWFTVRDDRNRPPVAVEGAIARPFPARIPACGIIAPGSSDSLASATHHGYPPRGGSPC